MGEKISVRQREFLDFHYLVEHMEFCPGEDGEKATHDARDCVSYSAPIQETAIFHLGIEMCLPAGYPNCAIPFRS